MQRESQPLQEMPAHGECIFCNRKKRQVEAENNGKVVDTNKCESEQESGESKLERKSFFGMSPHHFADHRNSAVMYKNNNNVPEFHFLSLPAQICEKFECIVLSCSYSLARRERSKSEKRRN